jgi:hypothetical protein
LQIAAERSIRILEFDSQMSKDQPEKADENPAQPLLQQASDRGFLARTYA